MPSKPAQRLRTGSPKSRLALIAAVCCAMGLIPATAVAASPSGATTLQGLLTALLGYGHDHGQAGGGPGASTPSQSDGGWHGGGSGPSGAGAGGQSGGSTEAQGASGHGQGAGDQGQGSWGGHGSERHQTQTAATQTATTQIASSSSTSPQSARQASSSPAASHTQDSTQQTPAAIASPATPAASSTGTAAPAASAPTPSHGTGSAARARVHSRATAHVRRRAGSRRRSSRGGAVSARRTQATTAGGVAAASARRSAARRHPRAKATPEAAQSTPLQPVERTITRIVSVVPLPLRILIGALVALALALVARSRIAAARTKRLEQQRSELMDDVGLLQAALLPTSPQRVGPLGASTAYRPANGPAAGGDFYDLFTLEDGRLAAIVGDVSGHGRQALPHTALTRFTLRAYLEAGFSPRQALQTAGAALERQLGESFATVALAIYQPQQRILTYACAGHPPPIVLANAPLAAVSACAAPPIGAGMQTGTRQTTTRLPGAAQVCLHTDGVTDARVGAELYGAQRLTQALTELGPQASASQLLDRVARQTDAQADDMAACLLFMPGGAEAPQVLAEELQLDAERADSPRTVQFLRACGVAQEHLEGVLAAARSEIARAGSAVLEVRPAADGRPAQADVQPDNLALLDSVKVRRQMAVAL